MPSQRSDWPPIPFAGEREPRRPSTLSRVGTTQPVEPRQQFAGMHEARRQPVKAGRRGSIPARPANTRARHRAGFSHARRNQARGLRHRQASGLAGSVVAHCTGWKPGLRGNRWFDSSSRHQCSGPIHQPRSISLGSSPSSLHQNRPAQCASASSCAHLAAGTPQRTVGKRAPRQAARGHHPVLQSGPLAADAPQSTP